MLVLDEFCFFANIISTRYESFNPLARSPAGALLFFLIAFFFLSLVRSRLSFLFLMNEDESATPTLDDNTDFSRPPECEMMMTYNMILSPTNDAK